MTAELLVLDDIGAEKTSEWVEETLNLIVTTRYNERRLTIFTSNYEEKEDRSDPDSLLARVGFRMHSRLYEMCEFLEFDGADYRHRPPNAGPEDLLAMWKLQARPAGAAAPLGRPCPRATAHAGSQGRRRVAGRAGGQWRTEPLGLYVHVPFCASICSYCNFTRGLRRPGPQAAVRRGGGAGDSTGSRPRPSDASHDRRLRATPAADTIYFGGGTPSLLAPADIGALIRRVPRRVRRRARRGGHARGEPGDRRRRTGWPDIGPPASTG